MLNQKQMAALDASVRTVQIIAFALIMGIISFFVLLGFLVEWEAVHTDFSLLANAGLVFGGLTAVMASVIARLVSRSALQVALEHLKESGTSPKDELGMRTLVGVFQTKLIVQYALLESAAFFNGVLFFVDKSIVSLVAGVAVTLMMIALFPRTSQIHDWVDDILRG